MRNLILVAVSLFFFACNNENTVTDPITENTVVAEKAKISEPITEAVGDVEAKEAELREAVKAEVEAIKAKAQREADRDEKAAEVKKEVVKKEEPKKKKKRAKISFQEETFDFGDIRDGDIVKHDFKFKNTGNAPLNIKNVTATCGCTQPSFPFLPIEPGEEGIINVTFNSTGKINEQRPTVTVITNGRPSIVKLNLKGMVRQKL